jgi:hypothetical protein
MTSIARDLLLTMDLFYFSRTDKIFGSQVHACSRGAAGYLANSSSTHVANLREYRHIPGEDRLPNAI